MLEAAYHLLGRPLGTLELARDLAAGQHPWVRQPFVDELEGMAEELAMDDVRALVYNMLASVVERTSYWSEPLEVAGGAYDFQTNEMMLFECEEPIRCSFSLVHEAAHGWLRTGHVPCPEGHILEAGWDYSGMKACDEERSTVWGMEAAVITHTLVSVDHDEPDSWNAHQTAWYNGNVVEFFILEE